MRRLGLALALAGGLWMLASSALADTAIDAVSAPASQATSGAGERADKFEGAVGLVMNYTPSYAGAADHRWTARPAGFLRYGRWSLTGAGGFTTHRNEDVERGLAAELARRGDLRLRLGLHLDRGRREDRSTRLAGMGDLPTTLRPSLSARWQADAHTVLTAHVTVDLLNRVGGVTLDLGASRRWDLAEGRALVLGASLSLADAAYMQAWHGVNSVQAQRSGLAEYRPGGGVRGTGVGLTYRHEFGPSWASFVGVQHARVLGGAADSPLTVRRGSSWISAGVAWRF